MRKPFVFISYASKEADVQHWLSEADKISTDLGYDLFERIITHNHVHRWIIDEKITGEPKFVSLEALGK